MKFIRMISAKHKTQVTQVRKFDETAYEVGSGFSLAADHGEENSVMIDATELKSTSHGAQSGRQKGGLDA